MKENRQDRTWRAAQQEELKCWDGVRAKIRSPDYVQKKRVYWERVLTRLGLSREDLEARRVLEVGCGPSGLTILLEPGRVYRSYCVLDPLLEHYRRDHPEHFSKCVEVDLPLEEWSIRPSHAFDLVFAINVIDHCADIERFMQQLGSLADINPDVTIYVGVNTHNFAWAQWIWRTFQRVLEPYHPYQHTSESYEQILGEHFVVRESVDIEPDVLWINSVTASPDRAGLRRFLVLLEPRAILVRILELLGYPLHDCAGVGRSIFRHRVYVLRGRPDPFAE